MGFRLLEIRVVDVGQRQGYFDLFGRWEGTALTMDDRGQANGLFRTGLKVEHASIRFFGDSYSDFKAACAKAIVPSSPPHS